MPEADRYTNRMLKIFGACHFKLRRNKDPFCAVTTAADAMKFHLKENYQAVRAILSLTQGTLQKLYLAASSDFFAEEESAIKDGFWAELDTIVGEHGNGTFINAHVDAAMKCVELGVDLAPVKGEAMDAATKVFGQEVANQCIHDILVGGKKAVDEITDVRKAKNLEPLDVREFFTDEFVPQAADLLRQAMRKDDPKQLRRPGRRLPEGERFQMSELTEEMAEQ